MRKSIAVLLALTAAASVIAASSCGKKVKKADQTDVNASTETTASVTAQPDPLTPTEITTVSETETTSVTTTEAPTELSTGQIDPLGGGAFRLNSDGALVFEGDPLKQDDRLLMAAAEALFRSAMQKEWDFRYNPPFTFDSSLYIENSFGWRYFKITDDGINSYADILDRYHKVFSEKYISDLSEYYKESDGNVYLLQGGRGSDIYYSTSKIVSVDSKSEGSISFTVENHYDGTDIDGSEPYSEKKEFSIEYDQNGVWRVVKFTLPN